MNEARNVSIEAYGATEYSVINDNEESLLTIMLVGMCKIQLTLNDWLKLLQVATPMCRVAAPHNDTSICNRAMRFYDLCDIVINLTVKFDDPLNVIRSFCATAVACGEGSQAAPVATRCTR